MLLTLLSTHPEIGIHSFTANRESDDKAILKARQLHEKGIIYSIKLIFYFLRWINIIARGLLLRGLVDPDDEGMHPVHRDEDNNLEVQEKEGIDPKILYLTIMILIF